MSTITNQSVWVVAQHPMDRCAYRALLIHELGQSVCGECDFAFDDILEAIGQQPDIFLFLADYPTPIVRIILSMVRESRKSNSLVVVLADTSDGVLKQWVRCPIDGLVTRASDNHEFRAALRAIETRQRPYYSDCVKTIIKTANCSNNGEKELSSREAELLPLLARGLSLREAAQMMSISYKTADYHRGNLFKKLGLRNRVALSLYATREGIISP